MKKLLIVLLALGLLLAFAACGGQEQEEPVSDTDLTPYEEEPVITEMEGELSDLEALLDHPITLPEEWTISRCTVIDDYMGQIEFTIGETSYVARYAKGQHENMSAMEKNFSATETVEVNGVSTTLRYTDPEESSGPVNFGVADAYDAGADVTFCVIQKSFTSVEDLTAAMEALMESVSDSGDTAAATGMEEEICYS